MEPEASPSLSSPRVSSPRHTAGALFALLALNGRGLMLRFQMLASPLSGNRCPLCLPVVGGPAVEAWERALTSEVLPQRTGNSGPFSAA